jgi:tRNA (adenine37-N6)-methyltransferase
MEERERFCFSPIGIIHSPFTRPEGMPIQPRGADGIRGTIELFDEYTEGLDDLAGFSRIILVYVFDRSKGYTLRVTPFLDTVERGLFATRAPRRPVPVGISAVRLLRIFGNTLEVADLDICDNTPLLDIKPYVSRFDSFPNEKSGWLEDQGAKVKEAQSDRRFTDE